MVNHVISRSMSETLLRFLAFEVSVYKEPMWIVNFLLYFLSKKIKHIKLDVINRLIIEKLRDERDPEVKFKLLLDKNYLGIT